MQTSPLETMGSEMSEFISNISTLESGLNAMNPSQIIKFSNIFYKTGTLKFEPKTRKNICSVIVKNQEKVKSISEKMLEFQKYEEIMRNRDIFCGKYFGDITHENEFKMRIGNQEKLYPVPMYFRSNGGLFGVYQEMTFDLERLGNLFLQR